MSFDTVSSISLKSGKGHNTVKNAVYRNTPEEQYFTVSMVTYTVTMETVKYCSPGVFSYTTYFTVKVMHYQAITLRAHNVTYCSAGLKEVQRTPPPNVGCTIVSYALYV